MWEVGVIGAQSGGRSKELKLSNETWKEIRKSFYTNDHTVSKLNHSNATIN